MSDPEPVTSALSARQAMVLAIVLAIITSLTSVITNTMTMLAARSADTHAIEAKTGVQQLEIKVDGRLTELLAATKAASHAAGVADEATANTARSDAAKATAAVRAAGVVEGRAHPLPAPPKRRQEDR